jgi:hypothetical protein
MLLSAVSIDSNDLKLSSDIIPDDPKLLTLDGFPHSELHVYSNTTAEPESQPAEPGEEIVDGPVSSTCVMDSMDCSTNFELRNRDKLTQDEKLRGKNCITGIGEDEVLSAFQSHWETNQVPPPTTPQLHHPSTATSTRLGKAQSTYQHTPQQSANHGASTFVELDSDDDSPRHFALNASQMTQTPLFVSPLMSSTISEETPSDLHYDCHERSFDDSMVDSVGESVTASVTETLNDSILTSSECNEISSAGNGQDGSVFVVDSDDETPIKDITSASAAEISSRNQELLQESDQTASATVSIQPQSQAQSISTTSRFQGRPFLSRLFSSPKPKSEEAGVDTRGRKLFNGGTAPDMVTSAQPGNLKMATTPNSDATVTDLSSEWLHHGAAPGHSSGDVRNSSDNSKIIQSVPSMIRSNLSSSRVKNNNGKKVGYRVFQMLSSASAHRAAATRVYEFSSEQCPWYCTLSLQLSLHFEFDTWYKQRIKYCEAQSKRCQQRIIHVSRALEAAKLNLALATEKLTRAKV